MVRVRDPAELAALRDSVQRIGRLSDSIVRLGPISLGIDGVLSWIPGLGELYSTGAAAFILVQGARAGVPASTLALAGAMLAGRTVISAVPLAGPAAADLFTAHKWSARMVARAIDRKLEAQGWRDGAAAGFSRAGRRGRSSRPAAATA